MREEQLASENLSDIQRFLQLSNHTESPQADGDFVAPDLSVAAGSSGGGDDNDRPRVVSESSARPARTGSLLSEEVGGSSAAAEGKTTDDDSEVVIMQELPAKVDRLSGYIFFLIFKLGITYFYNRPLLSPACILLNIQEIDTILNHIVI